MSIKIEITADGSHTLFVPALNEHYHSVHGAIVESNTVYIDAALRVCRKRAANVLEIGFGTGLNAFLSLMEAERAPRSIRYTALELYPLSVAEAEGLNYAERLAPDMRDAFLELHRAPWGVPWPIGGGRFSLQKLQADAGCPANIPSEPMWDVIFFDAFAPDKQPDLWTAEIFERLYAVAAADAVLSTYCAKGAVRRAMEAAGFAVERLPGPPGKREILRARKR